MSRSQIYQLNDYDTLDLVETDSDTATPVAGIQSVVITGSQSLEFLFTGDSNKRADVFGHEHEVNVEIGYAFFDSEVVSQWLGGGGGTSASSWNDDSDPQLYELTADFRSRDGSQALDVTVSDIVFPEMPIVDLSRGEYAQWDLTGTGADITDFTVGSPA